MSTEIKTESDALAAGPGKAMSWFESSMRLKASSPDLGVVEVLIGPGDEPPLHVLVMNTPGGFERMFEMAPKTPEDAVRALNAVDIEVVGPHPRRAAP